MWLEREVDRPGVMEDRKLQAHGPFLPGQNSEGACSSCDSCSGTLSLTLGPAPPGLPAGRCPCGLESQRPPGWMRPGRRPRGDAEGRGVAPEQRVPAPLPSIASCSVWGAGLCPHCCWRAAPHPRLRS